jgi:hypothetical protein
MANRILSMSQHKYITDLLQKFDMVYCNTEPTPQAKSTLLDKEESMNSEQ